MQQWICHIKGLENVLGAREVERLGRQIDGVEQLVVNYAAETLVVSAASRDVLKRLEHVLGRLGYTLLNKGYTVQSTLSVENLADKSVQQHIQKKIGAHTFVQKLDILPLSKTVVLVHSADFSISEFVCELNNEGVKANLLTQQLVKSAWQHYSTLATLLATLLLLAGVLTATFFHEPGYAFIAYFSSLIFSAPLLILKAGRQFLLSKKMSYEILLVLLSGFSLYLGLWFEAAFMVTCFSLLNLQESKLALTLKQKWAAIRAHESGVAFVKTEKGRFAIPINELSTGQVINLMANEIVPVDGVILSGEAKLTKLSLVGEPLVEEYAAGDKIFAGMRLISGEVDVRPVADNEGVLGLLHRKLEALQTQITDVQQVIKKYAQYYLYFSMLIFLVVVLFAALLKNDFVILHIEQILAFLAISGVAFIVVSIQYAYLFSAFIAAQDGLYFFSPGFWKKLSSVDTIILDKNGVVTCDKPEVHEVISLSDYPIKKVLTIAASLAHASDEERFRPVIMRAEQDGLSVESVTDLNVVKGKSASGKINGQYFQVGSQSSMENVGLITPHIKQKLRLWQEEGANIILLADESRVFGLITVIDPVRDEISEFIDCAHEKLGMKVIMLSHDNEGTSQVLANRYGFDDVVSELTNDGKARIIEDYNDKSVLLISNRHDLVLSGKKGITLLNHALKSEYVRDEAVIISLGVRLLSVLKMVAMAKKINHRTLRLLYVVGLGKVLMIMGIISGFLAFGVVIGLDFLLAYWVLVSTSRFSTQFKY